MYDSGESFPVRNILSSLRDQQRRTEDEWTAWSHDATTNTWSSISAKSVSLWLTTILQKWMLLKRNHKSYMDASNTSSTRQHRKSKQSALFEDEEYPRSPKSVLEFWRWILSWKMFLQNVMLWRGHTHRRLFVRGWSLAVKSKWKSWIEILKKA